MNIFQASKTILNQLLDIAADLSNEEYSKSLLTLNKSSIGQHIRHTIEFYQCLIQGIETGTVNYDQRVRSAEIESNSAYAVECLSKIIQFLDNETKNQKLSLIGNFSMEEGQDITIETNLFRELAYNHEHAVHHMAIIKIGISEACPSMILPSHFGVAVSTVRHLQN